jgi:hypothetical protein
MRKALSGDGGQARQRQGDRSLPQLHAACASPVGPVRCDRAARGFRRAARPERREVLDARVETRAGGPGAGPVRPVDGAPLDSCVVLSNPRADVRAKAEWFLHARVCEVKRDRVRWAGGEPADSPRWLPDGTVVVP